MTPPAASAAEALPRAPSRSRPGTRRAPNRRPRRISGPARPLVPGRRAGAARPGRDARTVVPAQGLALRAFERYRRIADSPLLDRIARGRLWIGLLAFALIGIVAMQLMALKLNAGIGATLAREADLQRENAQLGIEASTAAGEGQVEPLAAASGMIFAAPGSVHFVSASPADLARAAAALAAPIQPREAAPAATAAGEAPAGSGEATSTGGQGQSGEAGASGEAAPGAAAGSGTSESASFGQTASSGPSEPASSGGEAGSQPPAGQTAASTAGAGSSQAAAPVEPEAQTPAAATAGGAAAGGVQAGG